MFIQIMGIWVIIPLSLIGVQLSYWTSGDFSYLSNMWLDNFICDSRLGRIKLEQVIYQKSVWRVNSYLWGITFHDVDATIEICVTVVFFRAHDAFNKMWLWNFLGKVQSMCIVDLFTCLYRGLLMLYPCCSSYKSIVWVTMTLLILGANQTINAWFTTLPLS